MIVKVSKIRCLWDNVELWNFYVGGLSLPLTGVFGVQRMWRHSHLSLCDPNATLPGTIAGAHELMVRSGVSVIGAWRSPYPRVSEVASSLRAVTRGSNPCPDNKFETIFSQSYEPPSWRSRKPSVGGLFQLSIVSITRRCSVTGSRSCIGERSCIGPFGSGPRAELGLAVEGSRTSVPLVCLSITENSGS
jgi:hypothetical protein